MAFDQFMKLIGIKGESKDSKHTDEIETLAWSWGATQTGTMHSNQGGGAGKVNVQDLHFTKPTDLATPSLFGAVCTGQHIDSAVLTVRKAGGTALDYLIITMTHVIVTSWQSGGSGGEDRLTENVSLNFAEVDLKYVQQDTSSGQAGAQPDFKYNIQTNSKG